MAPNPRKRIRDDEVKEVAAMLCLIRADARWPPKHSLKHCPAQCAHLHFAVHVSACMYMCVRLCMRARACVRVRACACVRACVDM